MAIRKKQAPVHPGEVLYEEFLKPLGLTKYRLAKDLKIPPQRVGDIVNCKRSITPDSALRLARYFNTTPNFWLGLQMEYDLDHAEDELEKEIYQEVHPCNLIGDRKAA